MGINRYLIICQSNTKQDFDPVVNVLFTSSSCKDIFLGKRFLPCGAIQVSEMLLADSIYTSLTKPFHLFAVGCLQWAKYTDVTGLEFVGGVGRETTQDNVVFETNSMISRVSCRDGDGVPANRSTNS